MLIADEMGLGKTVQVKSGARVSETAEGAPRFLQTGGFVVREKECYAQALTIAAHFLDDWPLLVVCPSSM